jgi:sugar/nucleoside kinase (ribokinase family)
MQYLKDNKIDNSLIVQKEGVPTGQAYILTANKDNSILIVGGANQDYGAD